MNYLKPLLIAASVFAVSFSSLAYNGNNNCDGTWHRGGYQNNAQSNDNALAMTIVIIMLQAAIMVCMMAQCNIPLLCKLLSQMKL